MSRGLADNKPIFLQIKEKIEDQIVNGEIKEHEQIPSTNQLVQFYKINHLTVAKGINLMVDDEIIYKKRGVGMFVAEGAREKLLAERKSAFADEYIWPMLQEAQNLGMTEQELTNMIAERRERGSKS